MLAFPASLLVGAACSETTRYKTLTFFFDGVPKPGEQLDDGDGEEASNGGRQPRRKARRQAPPKKTLYHHPPYWESRCSTCHNPDGGQLFATAAEGLCQSCHADLPGEVKYVHGPVAVNECLFCHHYHSSEYEKLLLAEATELCFRCHAQADLSEASYHAAGQEEACLDCHDPHGGDNAFFLKGNRRWGPYLHGPVAVGDCDFCHHYREVTYSPAFPDTATGLCFRCHRPEDLTSGQHHAAWEEQSCLECHDPHGGEDRFFLKRAER